MADADGLEIVDGKMSAQDLIKAARHGNIQEVLRLLDVEEVNTNSTGGHRGSALGAAAFWGKMDIVSLLLDRGADINSTGGEYGLALGAAASNGNKEIVSLLLDRGADVNTTGGYYGSALGAAASEGHKEIVSLLLDQGVDVNITDGEYGSALGAAAYWGMMDIVSLLLNRGANVNAVSNIGKYRTALTAAALKRKKTIVLLLLGYGANANIIGGYYATALAAASYKGCRDIILALLEYPGTEINAIGGQYGTALGAALAAAAPTYTWYSQLANIKLLLDHGADINLVGCMYGSPLGKAVYEGDKKLVSLLLGHGADAFHVGGEYETVMGEYPTAVDAARAGNASEDIFTLLSKAMDDAAQQRDATPWPPFPMPFWGYLAATHPRGTSLASSPSSSSGCLETTVSNQMRTWDGNLTPTQANLPCKANDEELLRRALLVLVGVHKEAADRLKVWIRNDIRYLINQGYDLGLAYAAARVAWKHFNDPDFNVAVHRGQWLAKAKQLDEVRERAIYRNDTGQELIKSPYRIMPRRVWDLRSNRVVEFRMLHSDFVAREYQSGGIIDVEKAPPPPFWAITHSWTSEMSPVTTSINQYQWPIPLPRDLDLEHGVRRELLNKGAEYVWLDVLCLRQDSTANDTKHDEWKLDVPTIGNIYRAAVGIARYFNGLGQPFSTTGWDDPRHWLCRAWTLQEITSESTTYNAGILRKTTAHTILSTKSIQNGRLTTLRQALYPIVRLAAQVGRPSGCNVFDGDPAHYRDPAHFRDACN